MMHPDIRMSLSLFETHVLQFPYGLLVGWRRRGGRTNQVLGKNWPGYADCGFSKSRSRFLEFLSFL